MNNLCQTYIDNLATARRLAKPQLTAQMSPDEGLQAIRDNAEQLFWIHQENDQILNEILFSRTAEDLTETEAADLGELAQALFNYNRSTDTGIAYRIHRLLYAHARHKGDVDLTVKELYLQGITLMYLNVRDPQEGINLFLDQIGSFFQEGASYLAQYEELTNPQTRSYILRCLGNVKYGLKSFQGSNDGVPCHISGGWEDYSACFSTAMEIFQCPRYRQMNPEIPWDTFTYTMHYDRTQFLSSLRDKPDAEIAEAVLESAEHVYRHQEQIAKANDTGIGIRTQYVYMAARYHAGKASLEELLETLFQLCEAADIHDFSGDNIWTLMYTPEYLSNYSRRLPQAKQQKLGPRLQQAFQKQKEYLFLMPQNEYRLQVSRTLNCIAGELSQRDSFQLLDYVLACHPPTYVHSKMIALLTRHLCRQMIRVNPQFLDGVFGLETIREEDGSLEEMLDTAYHSGLYHDLGKCMLLSYVGIYSRRLLDEEFACIKLHPVFGCRLLKSLQMDDMASIAYYHHRTYDGGSGYPRCLEECPARIRPIVDIVTVADCLDAGTDNVGRSYAASKTYSQLVEELQAGRDSRYAPQVAALFDDPEFYSQTEKFLTQSRRQVYLDIYYPCEPS